MAEFDVYVLCNECGEHHSCNIRVNCEDFILDKMSIGELRSTITVPPPLQSDKNYFTCPNTLKMFMLADDRRISLVAVSVFPS